MSIVLATRNAKKLVELRRIVDASSLQLTVVGLDEVASYPEPVEDADTFEGNALLKAHAAVRETGMAALADDSGLEVDVLNLMPGVRSARWAGPDATDEDNLRLLLRQIDDVAGERRSARFVCAMALVLNNGNEYVVRGEAEGHLLGEPRGEQGFGYDPIFVPLGHQRTTAQMMPREKDELSHRGKAVRQAVALLQELSASGSLEG